MNRDALRAPTWDRALMQPLEPPAAARLGDVAAPMLVVVGEYDLPHCHEAADILAGSVPRSRKVIVPDTAHLPSLERPDIVNPLLKDFLIASQGLWLA